MNDVDSKLRNEALSLRDISDAALLLESDGRVEMAKKIKKLESQVKDLGTKLNDCAERNMKHKVSVMDLEEKLAEALKDNQTQCDIICNQGEIVIEKMDLELKLKVAVSALLDARAWLGESNYPNACHGIDEALKKISEGVNDN